MFSTNWIPTESRTTDAGPAEEFIGSPHAAVTVAKPQAVALQPRGLHHRQYALVPFMPLGNT
jgi:hypothetical protein